MDCLMAKKSLPPGFRFHPTDEELFMHYLKRKVMGKSLRPKMITELDVYKYAPWDLPDKSCLKTRDLNWYFFCPRAKKYANGARANRATECGYWKSTGNDRTVIYNDRPVGKIKTLIFHRGKPPNGDRTDWVMHEYRLEDNDLRERGIPQDSFVICKFYQKKGLGPRNGEHYCAPFVEDEWDSDDDDENMETDGGLVLHPVADGANDSHFTSTASANLGTRNLSPVPAPSETHEMMSTLDTQLVAATPPTAEQIVIPIVAAEEDELDNLLASFTAEEPLGPYTHAPVDHDIFGDLPDLPDASCGAAPPLPWYIANGCYLELDDLG